MKIKINQVQNLLIKAAKKFVSNKEALYFAKEQIDTHLKKYPRTNPLEEAIGDLESWEKNLKNKMEIQVDKKASLLLNFNKLGPSLKLEYIHDELEIRAKKYGISMLGINNSAGIHTLNLWTDGLGKRDLISLCFFNGGPDGVIPYKGTKGIFGTNPLSYAIPTTDKPIIVDMATSNIPYFEIRNAKAKNKKLEKGVAVDSNGRITTDPKKALADNGISNLIPLGGGYKGYALVLLIEILTGSLVRSFLSSEMTPGYVNEEHGGLILAIDIRSFTDLKKFKQSVSKMAEVIRSQKPAPGIKRITLPGDRNYEKLKKALKKGEIKLDKKVIERLENLSK